jgi:transcriptional regulator with XRE-family HTH domain
MPEKYAEQVGQNIKKLRGMKGLTRYQLAEAVDVAYSTIGLWETGKTFPRSSAIEKLSILLEVPKDMILGESAEIELFKDDKNKTVIDLTTISDENTLVIYKNKVLTKHEINKLEIILKGLFLDE